MIPQSHIDRVCATTGMEPVQAYRHLKALRDGLRTNVHRRYYSDQKFQEEVDAQQARFEQEWSAWHDAIDAARDGVERV